MTHAETWHYVLLHNPWLLLPSHRSRNDIRSSGWVRLHAWPAISSLPSQTHTTLLLGVASRGLTCIGPQRGLVCKSSSVLLPWPCWCVGQHRGCSKGHTASRWPHALAAYTADGGAAAASTAHCAVGCSQGHTMACTRGVCGVWRCC
jgi:hypothetical protein